MTQPWNWALLLHSTLLPPRRLVAGVPPCLMLLLPLGISTVVFPQPRAPAVGRGVSPRMFHRERSIPLRCSAGALCNNLSVLQLPARNLMRFGVVHGSSAQLLSAAPEGVPLAQRQLHAKEGAGVSSPLITQVHWCVLPVRVLLVLTSHRGIQMYEADGSVMVYWHALDSGDAPSGQAVFARGIAVSGHFICVGTWSGRVLVFDIPAKGPNIVLTEELAGHQTPVTDIASASAQGQLTGVGTGDVAVRYLCPYMQETRRGFLAGPAGEGSASCPLPPPGKDDAVADVVTADDSGLLCVWLSGSEFTLLTRIPGFGVPCISVQLWQGIVAAGYGNGQVRLYEATTGTLHVQINAHARAISALDLAPEVGKLLSAAEDTFVHIWKLSRSPESGSIEVEHCHGECISDTQVCGARFCDPSGRSFAVTAYDLNEILRFSS